MTYIEQLKTMQTEPYWAQLEGDKPCKDPTVYTSSYLGTYTKCPYKAYLKYKVGARPSWRNLGAVLGRSIHRSVQALHRNNGWRDWLDIYRENWDLVYADPEESDLPWSSKTADPEKAFADGSEMLSLYIAKNQFEEVWALEIPFRTIVTHPVTGTRYRMAGRLDQIRSISLENCHGPRKAFPPWTIEGLPLLKGDIWDVKSGGKAPSPGFIANAIQPTAYIYGASHGILLHEDEGPVQMPWLPSFTHYHLRNLIPYKRAVKAKGKVAGDSRGEPEIDFPRTEEEITESFPKQVCNIIRGMRMGVYFKADSDLGGCDMCEMKRACTEGMFMAKEDPISLAEMPGEGDPNA